MNKKLILTEQQHNLIINQILKETVEKIEKLESEGTLNEGFWDAIKYGLSKLGRYKAGGKIFGKSGVDQEYAEKIKKILDKEGNEMIRQLDAKIKEENPEFPNNKEPQQFLTTVMEIAAVYDSIVAATKLNPNEKGHMPIDAANGIINDLRDYVNKFLDVDLKAIYSATNEEKDLSENNVLTEEELKQIDEYFGLNEDVPARRNSGQVGSANQGPQVSGKPSGGSYRKNQNIEDTDYEDVTNKTQTTNNTNQSNPLNAKDVRAGLGSKRGSGDDFASTRMDTLKSNKLPLVLAGVGASLGALGWMAQTDWFKDWLESLLSTSKTITNSKDVVNNISGGQPDSKGFVSWASKIMGKNITNASDVQEFIDKFGDKNVSHMFDGNGGGDSMSQVQKLKELISSDPNASVGEMFNKADQTFGDMKGGRNLFGISKAASFFATTVTKQITKTVVKTGGSALVGTLAGLGSIVAGIGIGLITTGALLKLIRMKGQKSSRAATLNALYQSMRNIEGGVGLIEPTDDKTGTQDGTTDGQTGNQTGGATDGKSGGEKQGGEKAKTNLYNNLKSIFQFIVNNKNTMGTKTQYNTGTGGASVQNQLSEGKYINDKRLIQYLTKYLPFDKLKNFEDLLNRVEIIRNSLKKMGAETGDKTLDNFLKQLDSNPIMLTNFEQLMSVNPSNAQEVNQLLAFIKETLLAVYSGNYKFGGMVDKMSTLGGGNINKVSEEELDEVAGYSASQPNKSFMKDANSRTTFKNNLVKFLGTAMNMFQYLHKTQGGNIARKDTSNKYTAPPARQKQTPAAAPAQQSGQSSPTGQNVVPENLDPKLMEELKRIKKIMLS